MPADDLRARIAKALEPCEPFDLALTDKVMAELATDPGNLPARMADAIASHEWDEFPCSAHNQHNYYAECAVCQRDITRMAEVALGVRDGLVAHLSARVAEAEARVGHAEAGAQLSSELLAKVRQELAEARAESEQLRGHILDIDAHATPYEDLPDDPGYVGLYLLTSGSLHRALGKVGHTAVPCQDAKKVAEVMEKLERVERELAGAKQWHDTYQNEVNARDEFFGDLLELLPGAENEGIDAYDQIPRAIKALRSERDRLEGELAELAHRDLNEALNDAQDDQAEVRIAGLTVYRGPKTDARHYAANVVRQVTFLAAEEIARGERDTAWIKGDVIVSLVSPDDAALTAPVEGTTTPARETA